MSTYGLRRAVALLAVVFCLMASLPLCVAAYTPAVAGEDPTAHGYMSVASNDELELYTAVEGDFVGTFAVRHKADGAVWYSSPLNARDDSVSIQVTALLSMVEITAYDREAETLVSFNSYADSVSENAMGLSTVKNGLRFSYAFPAAGITIPVEVVLDGAALTVTADIENLKEEGTCRLFDLSLLPYFCSGGAADEGWLLVPDGSGALLRFNNGKTGYGPYSSPVYGGDAVAAADTQPTVTQPVSVPVFGAKRGDAAMLAILTDGAAHSTVRAVVAGVDSEQNTVWSVASVRKASTYQLDRGWQGTSTVAVYPDIAPELDKVSVRYRFLAGEEAGLGGMANVCREYWGIADRTDAAAPVVVDTLGAVRKKTTFLGFPAWRDQRLTDFDSARDILETLSEGGVTELSLRYLGWDKQTVHGDIVNAVRPLSLLGGKAGFGDLAAWTAEQGIGFYPDVNWTQYSRNAYPFRQYFAAARDDNNQLTTRFFYKRNLLNRDRDLPTYWLLNRKTLEKTAAAFLKAFGKSKASDISLSGIGSVVYSDHSGKKPLSADAAVAYQTELLERAGKTADRVMTASPYMAAAVRSDVAVDLPTASDFDMLDEAVPFYQMVLSGAVSYCGAVINLQDDPDAAFLSALSCGGGLHYALTAERGVDQLKDTAYESWVSCCAADWTDTVLKQNAAMRVVYAELGSHRLVDYEVPTAGVSRSTFAGGGVLLVNTGDTAAAVAGVTVPAGGYTVVKGGGVNE